MVVEIDQPGAAAPVRLLGAPVKFSGTPADTGRLPGPGFGEHTREVLEQLGYEPSRIDELTESGSVAGPPEAPAGSFLG